VRRLFEGLEDSEKREAVALVHQFPNLRSRLKQTTAPLRQASGHSCQTDCSASGLASYDTALSVALEINSIADDNKSLIHFCRRDNIVNSYPKIDPNLFQIKNDRTICQEHHTVSRLEARLILDFCEPKKATFEWQDDGAWGFPLCQFQEKTAAIDANTARLL